MRNTFLNGQQTKTTFDRSERSFYGGSKKVNWNDNNMGKKDALISVNYNIDLFFQKDVKPVTTHKKLRPNKPIIKGRSNSADVRKSNNLNPQQMNSYINQNNQGIKFNNNNSILEDKNLKNNTNNINNNNNNSRINNFVQNNANNQPPPRSISLDQKGDNRKQINNNYPDKDFTKIQIITPNINSIINNNINNIYIQSPTDMDIKKWNQIYNSDPHNKMNTNSTMTSTGNNNSNNIPNLSRLESVGRKENIPGNNNPSNYNYNPKTNFMSSNNVKNNVVDVNNFTKNDSLKSLQNNLINSYDPKQIKVIDYSNNNYIQQKNGKIYFKSVSNFNNYTNFTNNNKNNPISSNNTSSEKPKTVKIIK